RGPHRRPRGRRHRGGGHARRALDSPRPLSQAPRHAGVRRRRGALGSGGRAVSLRSMTGFGRASGPVGATRSAEVGVRSVNSRFLDLTVKTKDTETALEPAVRRAFTRRVHRGKVEVSLRLRRTSPADVAITVDEALLDALLARLKALSDRYPIEGKLSVRD